MRIYTQEKIDHLIYCDKIALEPPNPEMRTEFGHLRNDMNLKSQDSDDRFHVFMRMNERFPENFSIGLIYLPIEDSSNIILLRFNGPHGGFTNDTVDPHPHFGYHIHKATAENINNGFSPERNVELTDKYHSYQEALNYFIQFTNLIDASDYFPIQP